MKVLVYGAGVIGSVIAARLATAGEDVALLARGQRLADLREHGLVLQNALTGPRTNLRLPVVDRLAPEDAYDWVLVVMPRDELSAILPALSANHATPNLLFLGNNAGGAEVFERAPSLGRAMLGFASIGGRRVGHVIQYIEMGGRRPKITLGETDGGMSLRLGEISGVLRQAGFDVVISSNIDAWLKTHAALILPIAGALYAANGDIRRLASTRDALVLLVRAMREGFAVLESLGIPLLPPAAHIYRWIPEPLLIFILSRFLRLEIANLGIAAHANAAHEEMMELAREFRELVLRSGIATPALDQLYHYIDGGAEAMREGSKTLALHWRGTWIAVELSAALVVLVLGLVQSRKSH